MKPVKASQVCAKCKRPKHEHRAVNFSDGNLISGVVLICPTAIWREARKAVARDNEAR